MAFQNAILFLAELAIYFVVMAGLFRLRHQLGIGIFFCALGAMHFLETYLAAILYIPFILETAISPGSTILFTGKLVMLLLVYIREDAQTVRQPIYGLLIGNALTVTLVFLLRSHEVAPTAGRTPDFTFMNEMGWLMVWGTVLLFVDSILLILLYERLGRWLRRFQALRLSLSAAAVLTLDQIGFWLALHLLVGAPASVLVGGWIAKMITACIYGVLVWAYLRYVESSPVLVPRPQRIADIFDLLTYRERYEHLLETVGRDKLTGAYDRSRLPLEEKRSAEMFRRQRISFSVLVVDIDRFKPINDEFGHAAGDRVLRDIAAGMQASLRKEDRLIRYGGDEFVICCNGLDARKVEALSKRIEARIAGLSHEGIDRRVTVSIGCATAPDDGTSFDDLFSRADRRLYAVKKLRHAGETARGAGKSGGEGQETTPA
ncbi:GGDEF domain-containing protein [Afifella pfennigii]|uniref:GGDEF domain-containing protein n=1 Tax=Afifella pfennigii TaxID=209897 RepID=UPI0005576344|nr:GGDEF domain-containing protein [Afifella pfennigii]